MTSAPVPQTRPAMLRERPLQGFVPRALALVAAAIATGLAFAAWQTNGPALLEALAANGLAWCL